MLPPSGDHRAWRPPRRAPEICRGVPPSAGASHRLLVRLFAFRSVVVTVYTTHCPSGEICGSDTRSSERNSSIAMARPPFCAASGAGTRRTAARQEIVAGLITGFLGICRRRMLPRRARGRNRRPSTRGTCDVLILVKGVRMGGWGFPPHGTSTSTWMSHGYRHRQGK